MKQLTKPSLSLLLLLSASVAWGQGSSSFDDTGSGDDTGSSFSSTFDDETSTTFGTGSGTRSEGRRRGSEDCGHGGHHGCRTTLFLPRPQQLNSARFFNPFWYGCDAEYPCFNFDIGFRYRESKHPNRIAECLFGRDRLTFSGSLAPHRPGDIFADDFGLSPNFRGSVLFRPKIRDYMVDFDMRWDMGTWFDWCEGAYFGLRGTAVHSRWHLNPCYENRETPTCTSTEFSNFPPCLMSQDSAPATNSLPTALSGDYTFGDMQEKWEFGRFRERDRDTKLANIDIILGYDFLLCEDYHFGAFLKASAPTGTKPDARNVFQPIIGNGHHWEFGGGIDAHYNVYDCDDQCFALYLNGNITHLFKDTQWRSFDFKPSIDGRSCLSRYTLLKEFDSRGNYTGHLINAINFTTRRVRSSFAIQGDAALRLLYKSCGWAIGIGYNVYGRSHEKLEDVCRDGCFNRVRGRHFGIKGTTGVCAINSDASTTTDAFTEPLSATQSRFRPIGSRNVPVDNAFPLEGFVTAEGAITGDFTTADDSRNCDTNAPSPVYVHCRDLNVKGSHNGSEGRHNGSGTTGTTETTGVITDTTAGTRGSEHRKHRLEVDRRGVSSQLSHKVFATIDYEWEDCGDCRPYFGIGGGYEFPHKGECRVCTPTLWEVWVRTGINY